MHTHEQALFWDPRRLRRRLRDWEWYRQLVGGQPGGANDSKSAKGGNKPGLGLKSAGEGDKSAGPLGRVATLWLQPLLVSVVEKTWDPLSVEQTRALVEVSGLLRRVPCMCVRVYMCVCMCMCECTCLYVCMRVYV